MAFGSGSSRRIAYVAETAFGVTPATPTFQVLRATGGGPRTNKSTETSKELQADRNVRDEMQLGQDVAGAYDFELSYGTFDPLLEGVLQSAWSNNVIKNGVIPKSFTFEETVQAGAAAFSRYTGLMANTMSLAINARAKVSGSLGLMGKKEALDTAIITGATYTAANTEPVWTASANVASLMVAGGTPKVKSLSLEFGNNLRTRPVVGDLYSQEFGVGMFDVTGTMDVYFEDNTLYQSVLNHGNGALSFTIGTTTLKKYTVLLPKIIFGNGERKPGGNDDDVMVTIPFRAVFDPTEQASVKITRAIV